MTPIEEKDLEPEMFGSVKDQVLDLVSDKRGYYIGDLLKKIDSTPLHLYRVLSKLKRKGLIVSKTMPKESQKRGLSKHSKVYFKNPKSIDLR